MQQHRKDVKMRLTNMMRSALIERIMNKKFDSIDKEQSDRALVLAKDIVDEIIIATASENWNFTEKPLDVWKRLPESWFSDATGISVFCAGDSRFSTNVLGPAGRVHLSVYPDTIKVPAHIIYHDVYTEDLSYSTVQRLVRYTTFYRSIEQDKRDTRNLLTKVFRSHTSTTSLLQMYPELQIFMQIDEQRKKSLLLPAPKPDSKLKELLEALTSNA